MALSISGRLLVPPTIPVSRCGTASRGLPRGRVADVARHRQRRLVMAGRAPDPFHLSLRSTGRNRASIARKVAGRQLCTQAFRSAS